MKQAVSPQCSISVIKIGGGLAAIPDALERVCRAVEEAARAECIVVVPGGGRFADTVREFDRERGLSATAAHWMALLAMDQYAFVLADRMSDAVLLEDPGSVPDVLAQNKVAVLAPSRWMRSADVLPHSWDVTSDSIAAFIAGALGATRLVLIKPVSSAGVDPCFARTIPIGLPVSVLSWDRVETLAKELSG
jgi:5-(aminomethyl)-3-furanmethanol phosphate kinase